MSKTFASYWNLASKAVCVGRNYVAHVKELNNTVPSHPFFFKPTPSRFLPLKGDAVIPGYGEDLHHEVELCVIIGRNAKDVKAKDAMDYVAGYSVGLDMTLRDVQNEEEERSALDGSESVRYESCTRSFYSQGEGRESERSRALVQCGWKYSSGGFHKIDDPRSYFD